MINFDSEKDFEDFLCANKEFLLEELDLYGDSSLLRQVDLYPYGICDILLIDVERINEINSIIHFNLVELKNTSIKTEHLTQCARYKTFFDNLFDERYSFEFHCHLIGMKTFNGSSNDLVYLAQSIDWLSVYECFLHPKNGINLKNVQGWGVSLSDTGHQTTLNEKISFCIEEIKNKNNFFLEHKMEQE